MSYAFLCPIDGSRPEPCARRKASACGSAPVAAQGTTVSCSKLQCLSNLKGCCNFVAVSHLESSEVAAADYYGVTPKAVLASAQSIRLAFILNAYSEYILSKPVMDVTNQDVVTLRSSRALYETWASSKSLSCSFPDLMDVLNRLLDRL